MILYRLKKAKVEASILKKIKELEQLNITKSVILKVGNEESDDEDGKIPASKKNRNDNVPPPIITNSSPRPTNYCVIRVYRGGSYDGYQMEQFNDALKGIFQTHPESVSVEFLDIKQVKQNKFTEKQFVDWLLASTIHFIIAHPHQGYGFGCWNAQGKSIDWDISVLYKELDRLRDHKGFPRLNKLKCPIFTQDKFEYLRILLDNKMANPSLRIPVYSIDDTFVDYIDALEEYKLKLFLLFYFHLDFVPVTVMRKVDGR